MTTNLESLSQSLMQLEPLQDNIKHTDYLSITTNDKGVALHARTAIELAKNSESSLPVALFISRGMMWSILPQLDNIEMALRVEINPKQIEQEKEWKKVIVSASSIAEVKAAAAQLGFEEQLESEIVSLGEQHYLYSEENLKKAQQKIRSATILYLESDLLNQQFIDHLSQSFSEADANIVFADMTNVMDWISRLSGKNKNNVLALLNDLPFNERVSILYSFTQKDQRMGRGAKPREVGNTEGVEAYLNATWQI